MLTLRNNLRITLILGLALLFSITAEALADKSKRQGRQQRTAERRAPNQAAQQPRIQKQQQAAPKRRVNTRQIPRANQQPRIQRRTQPIQKRFQKPATRQVRVEKRQQSAPVRRGQNKIQPQQQKQKQRTVKPTVKVQPVRQRKVTTVRKRFKNTRQQPSVTRSVKQTPRQNNRQVRVEKRRQSAPVRRGQNKIQPQQQKQKQRTVKPTVKVQPVRQRKVTTVRKRFKNTRQQPIVTRSVNKSPRQNNRQVRVERRVDRQVTRNVDIKKTVAPRRTKVTINRDSRHIIKRNRKTFTWNVNSTMARKVPNRYSRPRNERSHHRQKGKSARLYSHVVGRRPGRIFNRVVWPKYRYPVYYSYGRRHYIHYVRPKYHRKYIFFSIGSYWPAYYTSVRYYWYGSHVYRWYGCYPTAYSVGGDTYNYYTYNTYNTNTATPLTYTDAAPLDSVDHTTFEDIREKLDKQQSEPEPETLTDKFFQDGVVAFEQQDYNVAAAAFADAIALDPDDLILPFAYVQALFASEQYFKAADILRLALKQMPADQQGLFFPRGLYAEDEILFEQIEKLQTRAETFSYDPDLPLLLGYQLIGVEQHEDARKWLDRAAQYDLNENSTNILNDLLDKFQEQPEQTSQSL